MSRMVSRSRHAAASGLQMALLSVLCFSTVRAASFELPALNSPSSPEHHAGKVVWADLVTPDLTAAERFYTGLFGWTFQSVHTGDSEYAVALADGHAVGGVYQKAIPTGDHRQSGWLTFIAVRDVEAARRIAVANGAKVLADAKTYALRGTQAVLSDPEGAIFAVIASSSGDPPDYLASTGEWIWSSLLSKDPSAEAAFYQQVFGYDAFDVASDDGMEHVILSSDGFARASANTLPVDSKRRRAHWLNFVRVDNTTAMVAKVVSLGGRVLVEPHADRHGGSLAVVADPAGATFGLMEWTSNDSKAEPK